MKSDKRGGKNGQNKVKRTVPKVSTLKKNTIISWIQRMQKRNDGQIQVPVREETIPDRSRKPKESNTVVCHVNKLSEVPIIDRGSSESDYCFRLTMTPPNEGSNNKKRDLC